MSTKTKTKSKVATGSTKAPAKAQTKASPAKSSSAPAPAKALARSPYLSLHNLHQLVAETFERAAEGLVSPSQFELLNVIVADGSPSQTDIEFRTGIDRSTIAEVATRLAARGHIVRNRSKLDARAYQVEITKSGLELHRVGLAAIDEVNKVLRSVPGAKDALEWANGVFEKHGDTKVRNGKTPEGRNTHPRTTRFRAASANTSASASTRSGSSAHHDAATRRAATNAADAASAADAIADA